MHLFGELLSESLIPAARLQRLLRRMGARLSHEALEALNDTLESYAHNLAKRAVRLAQHAKRRMVTKEDVKLAARE